MNASSTELSDDKLNLLNTNKETIQQRHYFLLAQLQDMIKYIDEEYQSRFTFDLLQSLSSSLIDGTVFEIVRGLTEIQQITEKNLFNERTKILNDYQSQRELLVKRHKDSEQSCEQTRPHHLTILKAANKREIDAFDKRMNDELKRHDLKTLAEFDKKLNEQQDIMKKAGVPGFYPTNEPNEIKIQIYLFQFIHKLSQIQTPV